MKPQGKLVDVLECDASDELYASAYRPTYSRTFRSGPIESRIRKELHKYTSINAGEGNKKEEKVLSLAKLLYYYLPQYDAACNEPESATDWNEMSPERAVKLSLWYIEGYREQPSSVRELEEEIVTRLMGFVDFRIRKREFETRDELEVARQRLEKELRDLRRREKKLDQLYNHADSLSLIERLKAWFRHNHIRDEYSEIQNKVQRKEKELNSVRSIIQFPSDHEELTNWVERRDRALKQAINARKFINTYHYLKEEKQKNRKLSSIEVGDIQDMMQGAMNFIADGVRETVSTSVRSLPATGQEEVEEKTYPSYLELKNEYSDEEVEEIFDAINGGELELGSERQRIRSMLLGGNTRGAVEAIREQIQPD